jgi:hypothetical protein
VSTKPSFDRSRLEEYLNFHHQQRLEAAAIEKAAAEQDRREREQKAKAAELEALAENYRRRAEADKELRWAGARSFALCSVSLGAAVSLVVLAGSYAYNRYRERHPEGIATMPNIVTHEVTIDVPKVNTHEVTIDVPRVNTHEVTIDAPKVNTHEVTIDVPRVNTHEVTIDVPKVNTHEVTIPMPTPKPEPAPAVSSLPPKTPDTTEKKFIEDPDYKNADINGRIASQDGLGFRFDNGQGMRPVHEDGTPDLERRISVDGLIGDYAYCNVKNAIAKVYNCYVVHNDVTQPVPMVPATWPAKSSDVTSPQANPTPAATLPAANMVTANVAVGGWVMNALVDTGCSWPLSLSQHIADALVAKGEAFRAGSSASTLADGSSKDVEIIMIRTIDVEGHVLHEVEAAVSESAFAPTLLGLGALKRIGKFNIANGRITFS